VTPSDLKIIKYACAGTVLVAGVSMNPWLTLLAEGAFLIAGSGITVFQGWGACRDDAERGRLMAGPTALAALGGTVFFAGWLILTLMRFR
jgi:hypothetical protein